MQGMPRASAGRSRPEVSLAGRRGLVTACGVYDFGAVATVTNRWKTVAVDPPGSVARAGRAMHPQSIPGREVALGEGCVTRAGAMQAIRGARRLALSANAGG